MIRFRRNLSVIDRAVRLLVGLGCIYLGFVDSSIIANQLIAVLVGMFGVINLFAAGFSYCPVYAACGVNTARSTSAEQQG